MNHNKADGFERRLEVRFVFVPAQDPFSTHTHTGSSALPHGELQACFRHGEVRQEEKKKTATQTSLYFPSSPGNQSPDTDVFFFLAGYSYIYYTQVMQAETLASAYRLWRRNWKGKGKEYTAGALVWQVGSDVFCFVLRPCLFLCAEEGAGRKRRRRVNSSVTELTHIYFSASDRSTTVGL